MQLLERYFEGSLVLITSVVIMALVALSVQNVFFYLVDLLSKVELSFPDLILQLSDSVFLDLQLERKPLILILVVVLFSMKSLYLVALLGSLPLQELVLRHESLLLGSQFLIYLLYIALLLLQLTCLTLQRLLPMHALACLSLYLGLYCLQTAKFCSHVAHFGLEFANFSLLVRVVLITFHG